MRKQDYRSEEELADSSGGTNYCMGKSYILIGAGAVTSLAVKVCPSCLGGGHVAHSILVRVTSITARSFALH